MMNFMRLSGGTKWYVALWLAANSSLFAASVPPSSVTLGWTASSDPTVVGYSVSYGGASGVYTNTLKVGTNLTLTLSGLTAGNTYYFIANSYNAANVSSSPTPVVAFTVPLGGTTLSLTGPSLNSSSVNLQFQVVPSTSYELQASSNLIIWSNVCTFSSGSTNGMVQFSEPFTNTLKAQFYRVVMQ